MTNKSINLLKNLDEMEKEEYISIIKEVVDIEFKKIKAQAKLFEKNTDTKVELVTKIIKAENGEELYKILDELTIYEIALLSTYGIDVEFMYLIKVSE